MGSLIASSDEEPWERSFPLVVVRTATACGLRCPRRRSRVRAYARVVTYLSAVRGNVHT